MPEMSKWILISIFCLSSSHGYAQSYIVKMMTNDMGVPMFEPDRLLIQPGDTVVWKNVDRLYVHNVVADPTGVPKGTEPFESPSADDFGNEWSHRFDHVGTYHYHCHPHADKGMRGMIVVGRESRQDEFREGSSNQHQHHH